MHPAKSTASGDPTELQQEDAGRQQGLPGGDEEKSDPPKEERRSKEASVTSHLKC